MDYYQLDQHSMKSPSIQLLRSKNAPLVISFLYQNFREEHIPSIGYTMLREALAQYLGDIREQNPDSYPLSEDAYLRQWADSDHKWIRIRSSADGNDSVELTSYTQRALGWMEELEQRTFIATSSRFQLVLDQMGQLLTRSTADVETRLRQLQDEKAQIEAEIERIEQTGTLDTLTSSEVREQFYLTTEMASQLLQDFSAVEEAFQETAKEVHSLQLKPDIRKGTIVQNVLDADRMLRESDMGQSFYAFWSYLQLPNNQTQLDRQLDELFRVEAIAEIDMSNPLLRGLVGYLVRAGLKVEHSNQRLAEQLRRMLDEANLAESRRIRQIVADIKHLVIENRDKIPSNTPFMNFESVPATHLVMEHNLHYPEETVYYDTFPEEDDDTKPINLEDFGNYFYIDRKLLQENIDFMLEEHLTATLSQLLTQFPVQKGLSEIIAYLEIASKDRRHSIDESILTEVVALSTQDDDYSLRMNVPQVIFRRKQEESSISTHDRPTS